MSLAAIRSIPVESAYVPAFLEDLIDKKIANLALNIIERFVDWILDWVYCPYHQLYMEKKERIHTFDGRANLIDITKDRVAGIRHDLLIPHISINSIPILFNRAPWAQLIFAREANTDYVVVCDDKTRGAGWFKIAEQETSRGPNRPLKKFWLVSSSQVLRNNHGNFLLARALEA